MAHTKQRVATIMKTGRFQFVALSGATNRSALTNNQERCLFMLVTIAVILAVLWAVGFFAVEIGGGLIHILLVIALAVFIYNMVASNRQNP